MAIETVALRTVLAQNYATATTYGALTTTAPGSSTGTEVSGGSYARVATAWGTASASVVTSTAMTFNVPASTTVVGFELYSAIAGTYYDGVGITSQTFSSAGTYAITPTYTQS